MSETHQCPECGTPLPPSAPRGLCPACLLQRGLETNTAGFTADAPSTCWTPPAVDELAARFPELNITRLIGRGGMGAVYQAVQKNLDRTVALKILPPEMALDPAFAERFTREAQAMARLNHPHIVTLHEFGQRGGWYYFIMEYVDGMNLRSLLDAGHIATKEALAIVPQICDALQYAHDQGIVHRDIKPESILLNKQGAVKIADFGLAKLISPQTGGLQALRTTNPSPPSSTPEASTVLGTPQYMAPEQLDRPSEVDHRADIYSLGVVFYQMLTGELPRGNFAPPSRKVVIDVRLDEVVLRALEKEPEKRYQQVSEVKTQVETILLTPSPTTSDTSPQASDSFSAAASSPRSNDNPSIQSAPQFSRIAIVGAAWLCISIFGVLTIAGAPQANSPAWEKLLVYALLFVTVTSPFTISLLGWIAVSQIRRSTEKLYGLGLAVFEGLLFPLLILNTALVGGGAMLMASAGRGHISWALAAIILLPIAALADVLIIRRVWRAVKMPAEGPTERTVSAPHVSSRAISIVVFASVYVAYLLFLLLSHTFLPERVASHFDFEGQADAWMNRRTFILFIASVPPIISLVFWFVGGLFRILPASCVNIPRKDYWLAPQRLDDAVRFIQSRMLWLASLLTLYFAGLYCLTLIANRASPPQLPMGPLLGLTIAFLLIVMIWLVALLMHLAQADQVDMTARSNLRNGRWIIPALLIVGILFGIWALKPHYNVTRSGDRGTPSRRWEVFSAPAFLRSMPIWSTA